MEIAWGVRVPVTVFEDWRRWVIFYSVRCHPTNRAERFIGEGFFNSDCEKSRGNYLEARDYCPLDLFAPKLIHVHVNCSNVYSFAAGSFQVIR